MKKFLRNLVVVFLTLALVGFLKRPFDDRVAEDLRERELLSEPLKVDTWQDMGQTGLAVSLGGLRSLIACLMNLSAIDYWSEQEWYELERTYETIVNLQPKTGFYWETAGWHFYSNAYADYEFKPEIPDGRRRKIQQEFYKKGIHFLARGLEKLPDDPRMWQAYAEAHDQFWRPRDLKVAAESYKHSFELSGRFYTLRRYLYATCRIPGREQECWDAIREVWQYKHNRQFRATRHIYFAMQNWANPPRWEWLGYRELYGNEFNAAISLPDHWFRQHEGYPVYGVADALNELCAKFGIPPEIHPLRFDPEEMLSRNPIDNEVHKIDPKTGKPYLKPWRTIWTAYARTDYRQAIRKAVLSHKR